jgi:predicted nucleic acid-binding protein
MKDRQYLIDSNIIIYHLNGEAAATEFLIEFAGQCFISRLTFIEVLSFELSKKEEQKIRDLLETFSILDTSEAIALQCIENRKIRKIKIADNIIGSTAQVNNLTLVTRNIKDFTSLEIEILNIFKSYSTK